MPRYHDRCLTLIFRTILFGLTTGTKYLAFTVVNQVDRAPLLP